MTRVYVSSEILESVASGEDSYVTNKTFVDLGVSNELVAVLTSQGITTAFPIQAMTIADALCAFGVREHWPEGARSFTTIECKANFLSSAKEGEVVIGNASPLHIGRSTQVWDATVYNETTERQMAAYRCTQMILY